MVLAGLIAALGLGAGAGAVAYAVLSDESTTVVRQVTVNDSETAATTDGLSIGDIYERSQKAVVEITASATQFSGSQSAQGSGFVFDEDGHIITNQHVVEGASSISVRFWDGSSRTARLVGTDPSTDLAVIDVNAPASFLEPLRLGDSSDVDVGDGVVAMGSPFGLEGTVTSGIVSALHRQMTAPNNFTITDSIQTDAAINHGNSGGPLLNLQGQVVGINSAGSDSAQSIGFAIAIDSAKDTIQQAIDSPLAPSGYLGVQTESVSAAMAYQLNLKVDQGAYVVATTDGSGAADAGIQSGDVIVSVDGSAVTTAEDLGKIMSGLQPGTTVTVVVDRAGQEQSFDVVLGSRPMPALP